MEAAVEAPSIPLTAVSSSQIEALGHDPATNTLAIQFKGKGDKPGSIYHYANVTPDLFEAFKGAKSIGSHFYAHIKPHADKFPYRRIG